MVFIVGLILRCYLREPGRGYHLAPNRMAEFSKDGTETSFRMNGLDISKSENAVRLVNILISPHGLSTLPHDR